MKFTLVCVVLLSFVLLSYGMSFGKTSPLEEKLCTPEQWEGFTVSWYPEKDTLIFSNVSYDFSGKRLALDVEKIEWEKKEVDKKTFSMLLRFDKKKGYFFQEESKNCSVVDLKHDFEEWCIPKEAKKMGPFTLGGKLKIHGFSFNVTSAHHSKDKNTTSWIYAEITADGIPVSAKYGNKKANGLTDFYDITPGIQDEDKFTPPDYCKDDNDATKNTRRSTKVHHTTPVLWNLLGASGCGPDFVGLTSNCSSPNLI